MKKKDPEFPPIHVLMCGDRGWDDDYIISIFVTGLKYWHGLNIHIWHGDAPGADTMAKLAAVHVGLVPHPYPADWDTYGKFAGPRRNAQMLSAMLKAASEARNSVVMGVAFKDVLDASAGTTDMVRKCLEKDVPVYVISRPLLEELPERRKKK